MSVLYLVSESDNDAVFYALCAEKLTGNLFEAVPLKNRKGDGVAAVKSQLRYALIGARAAACGSQPVAFIAAMDNDRAPHGENSSPPPGGAGLDRAKLTEKERARENRLAWMTATVEGVLGQNRNAWPLQVAIAVPVEMIESWIVRARREQPPQPMPHFSKADSDRARSYHAPSAPPPQWKDLAAEEQGDMDKRDFYARVVKELDADALAGRSLSFRMFKEWLDRWPRTTVQADGS